MDPSAAFGECIGVHLIEAHAAADLAVALEDVWRSDPTRFYEDGFQLYGERGGDVQVVTIGKLDWVEVDNHDDLARAREIACRY
jgi:choline kinase